MSSAASDDRFFSLTPERVLAAVEAAGLTTRPVCYPLNSFENRVYEVELEDRQRVIAKFYRPGRWSAEQILDEHRFLAELADDEIPVCEVRPFPDGNTLKQIDHIYYCVFDRRGGRSPDELGDRVASRLGMFIGRMHAVGARHPAPSRPRLDAASYVRDNVNWLADHHSLPPHLEKPYFDTALAIAEIAERYMEGVESQRIHADLHLGNVLFRDGQLWVFDFDDMRNGPPVQDLWLALPGRGPEARRLREILLEGYERFRLFDRSTLRLVEPLRGLRMVQYAAWLARRYHDPAFQAAWPQFATPDYWRQESDDLAQQLAVIQGEAAPEDLAATGVGPAPVEEALTNKDYFWDWEGD